MSEEKVFCKNRIYLVKLRIGLPGQLFCINAEMENSNFLGQHMNFQNPEIINHKNDCPYFRGGNNV